MNDNVVNYTPFENMFRHQSSMLLLSIMKQKNDQELILRGVGSTFFGEQEMLTIASLDQLKSLEISNNNLTFKKIKDITCSLHQLTQLDISCNNNHDVEENIQESLAFLQKLDRLTFLNISYNSINCQGAQAMASLLPPSLTKLSVRAVCISSEGAKAIACLSQLTSLDLGLNRIGPTGAQAIAFSLHQLTDLDLFKNGIECEGAQAIACLSRLTRLDVDSNKIGPKGAQAIACLSRLTNLDIRKNNIGDEGARAIALMPSLKHLDIQFNDLDADGLIVLMESLEKLDTIYLGWDSLRLLNIMKLTADTYSDFEFYKYVQAHMSPTTRMYRRAQCALPHLHKEHECLVQCMNALMEQMGERCTTLSMEDTFALVVIQNILLPQTQVEIIAREKHIVDYETENTKK